LAVQIRRLIPSMHWLLDSTSLSFVFLGKNITGRKRALLWSHCSFGARLAGAPMASRAGEQELEGRGLGWPQPLDPCSPGMPASCCGHRQCSPTHPEPSLLARDCPDPQCPRLRGHCCPSMSDQPPYEASQGPAGLLGTCWRGGSV
jgi:hypothetical protein